MGGKIRSERKSYSNIKKKSKTNKYLNHIQKSVFLMGCKSKNINQKKEADSSEIVILNNQYKSGMIKHSPQERPSLNDEKKKIIHRYEKSRWKVI